MSTRNICEPTGSISISVSSATHQGLVRTSQADRCLVSNHLALFAVMDGIGPNETGGRAAEIVAENLRLLRDPVADIDVVNALTVADRTIAGLEVANMGTTCTVLRVGTTTAQLVNIGDSRCYRARNGRLRLLTTDHSVAAEIIETGRLDPASPVATRLRNQLTRFIGHGQSTIDTRTVSLRSGDRYLLCSDGVWAALTNTALAALTAGRRTAHDSVEQIACAVLRSGAPDNFTALVIDIADLERQPK